MTTSYLNKTNWWVIVGSEENWDSAIQGTTGIWGVRDKPVLKKYWTDLKKGGYILFYVTSPVSGIVGYGQIESKNKQDKPLWPDELRQNKVIYPWRFYFNILHILPTQLWKEERLKISGIPFQAGLSRISNPTTIKSVIQIINKKWEEELEFKPERKRKGKKEKKVSLHGQIKEMIYEIGKKEKFISEKEVSLDGERLDVTWKKVMRGVPTKVFEVQISGSIHKALGTLKHAFDLWNSEPFLIIRKQDKRKVDVLLSGTFHEIADEVKVITTDKIKEFFMFLQKSTKLKRELNL